MPRGPGSERGTGPGVITPDGCAVELYALLQPMGEPEIVHAAVPAGASVLELGAGAGRVTHPLLALGHPVVTVDESAEMLARIRGAETARAPIQDLDLERRFEAGLATDAYLTGDGSWVRAVPASGGAALGRSPR
jgi:SAM-dependent methyltransferase